MIYAKHPALGNALFEADQKSAIEADGWVIWPRTQEQKNAAPQAREAVVTSLSTPEPVGAAPDAQPAKRKPGRPHKGA